MARPGMPRADVQLSLDLLRLALDATRRQKDELRAALSWSISARREGQVGGALDDDLSRVEALAENLRALLQEARQQALSLEGGTPSIAAHVETRWAPNERSVTLPSDVTSMSVATATDMTVDLESARAMRPRHLSKRARSSSSSSDGALPGSRGRPERIPGLSRHRGMDGQNSIILSNPDLLLYTFRFLVGGVAASRPTLSNLSLVCRKWRDLSRQDEFWRPIAVDCFPVIAEASRSETGSGDMSYRGYMLKHGRNLIHRQVWLGDEWAEGLRLSFEVFDQHDGLRLLSATGSLGIYIDEADGVTALEVKGVSRKEVAGPAFSASSRDPRYTTINDYFETAFRDDRPSCLCVRVTVWDERTGRSGTLWSSSKTMPFLTAAPNHHWQQALPPDSIVVVPRGWTSLVSPATQPVYLQAQVLFHVRPEPDQPEEVEPQHRLYRLAVAGPGSADAGPPRSCIELVLSTANRVVLGNYIRSILA